MTIAADFTGISIETVTHRNTIRHNMISEMLPSMYIERLLLHPDSVSVGRRFSLICFSEFHRSSSFSLAFASCSIMLIRHFCKCHGLAGVRGQVDKPKVILMQTCLNCESPLEQNIGGRSRKFCCSECRQTWWNKHQYMVVRKAFYTYTCPACGIAFTAYGNSHRKYCSHSCYIAARFRGVAALWILMVFAGICFIMPHSRSVYRCWIRGYCPRKNTTA